jgi:hypothetical protein
MTRTYENNYGPLNVDLLSGCSPENILMDLISKLSQAVSIRACILEKIVSILDSSIAYSKKFIVAFLRPSNK